MESLRLYGDNPRCWWCGKRISGEPRTLLFQFKKAQYDCIVCSVECEHATQNSNRYVQKFIPVFLIGILASISLIAITKSPFIPIGLFLLGTTIILCPFCTPQTTMMLGVRRSFILGRIIGVIVLIIALALLFGRLTATSPAF